MKVTDQTLKSEEFLYFNIVLKEDTNAFDLWGILPPLDDLKTWTKLNKTVVDDFNRKLRGLKKF